MSEPRPAADAAEAEERAESQERAESGDGLEESNWLLDMRRMFVTLVVDYPWAIAGVAVSDMAASTPAPNAMSFFTFCSPPNPGAGG